MTCKGVVVLNQPVVDVYNCEPSSYQNSSQSLVSCVCVMGWFTELHYAFGECACVFKFFLVHIWRGNRGGNKLKDKLVHDPLVSGKIGPYKNSISFRTHTHTHQWRNVLTVSLLRCSAMTRNTPSIPGLECTNNAARTSIHRLPWPVTYNARKNKWHLSFFLFVFLFPTCQVRVVRFYQSCSLPPRLALLFLLLLLLRLLRQFLLDHVCINFHLNFRLANSSPSSSPTSQLSAHCWTSTWDNPSSVCTAGPQPGTFPAQCAPLDLNLGPSQLSVHRWTSTWDLPSSVCTAGPQPGTFRAQCAPLDLNLGPSQLSAHRWT